MERREIAGLILRILGAGAVLTLALTVPNAAGHIIELVEGLANFPERDRRRTLSYLKTRGYVRTDPAHGRLVLTDRGRKRLQSYTLSTLRIGKPTKWDGQFRIVLFDIPKKPRKLDQARDALRGMLKRLGFIQLQKSAWAYPYPCEDEVALVAETFGISRFVTVATTTRISGGEPLVKRFNLSLKQKTA